MKNFSTCCASTEVAGGLGGARRRAALLLGLLVLLLVSPGAALKKPVDAEELFNPLLGVDYGHWLVGPIYHMVSDKEVEEYLLLASDEEAASFVAAFWQRTNDGTEPFKKTPEQLFEARAEKADSRYSEATLPGSLTDRGTIYILFGEPEETSFESSQMFAGPPIEIWEYAKDSAKGLNDEKPKKQYRFVQIDGKTMFFNQAVSEREARKRQRGRIRY